MASVKEIVIKKEQEFCALFNKPGVTADELVAFYATDCKMFQNGAPTKSGRQEVKQTFAEMLQKFEAGTCFTFSSDAFHEAGDFIIVHGDYSFKKDAALVQGGKYMAVYKKEDGEWRVLYDMFN